MRKEGEKLERGGRGGVTIVLSRERITELDTLQEKRGGRIRARSAAGENGVLRGEKSPSADKKWTILEKGVP